MKGPVDRQETRERFAALERLCDERARRFARVKLWAALRQRVDTDDVFQEALLEASRLFQGRRDLASMSERRFFPWLSRIIERKIHDLARFHIAAKRRSVRREERLGSNERALRLPASVETPSGLLLAAERRIEVRRALRKLTPREREVVTLIHLKGLKVARAAERLGKTPGATSVLLHHALAKLEKILERRRS